MQRLVRKGYTPITTPDLVKHKIAEVRHRGPHVGALWLMPPALQGTGFQPRGDHAQKQIYAIENEDLCLIATAEISLAGLYADKIIPVKQLPVKMVPCVAWCINRLMAVCLRSVCRTASGQRRAPQGRSLAACTACTSSVRWRCSRLHRRSRRWNCTRKFLVRP